MGWLNPKRRRRAWKKYGIRATYRCDVCDKYIPLGELIIIDPKRGYYPWPSNTPDALKSMKAREPKWTAHYACDPVKKYREKKAAKRKLKKELILKIRGDILAMIRKRPERGYWTEKKVLRKMNGFADKLVLRAITQLNDERILKKREGGFLIR